MNIEMAKVLYTYINKKATQRELAQKFNYSIGKINKIIKELTLNNYIDNNTITDKGLELVEASKVESAIILAAGYGLRMMPINNNTPKALLTVKGEILIERLIKQLKEKGINKIYVVVGFKKESFEYLIDKYHVELIINSDYKFTNNCVSLYKAVNKIKGNTYIIPSDLYFINNPFNDIEMVSYYTLSDSGKNGVYGINKKGFVVNKNRSNDYYDAVGLSYFKYEDFKLFTNLLKEVVNKNSSSYWEEALFIDENNTVYGNVIYNNDYYEINDYNDLLNIDNTSKDLLDKNIQLIMEVFNCQLVDIKNVMTLKKGMTNRSFIFTINNNRYIMRVPGEGTESLISRKNEASVYNVVNEIGICDEVIYINESNGIKITRFLENSRNCDSTNEKEVKECMVRLKEFHDLKLEVSHEFNLRENIIKYEKLMGNKSLYSDYQETRNDIFELLDIIEKLEKNYTLCHIDSVFDNFLFTDSQIKLIDWEYAGMNDAHVDIAMFAIYAGYDKEWIDKIIGYYFENKCEEDVRYKIYGYVSICGFLWSNWCEFKYSLGVEFGEYSLNQYRYAKKYSKIAQAYFREGIKYE